MPYKDLEKRRQTKHENYLKNKSKVRERANKRKRDTQVWFQEYKLTLKCSKCSENHPACIEFHHINPKEKEHTISLMASKGFGKDKIFEEIKKCDVLCSNCHKKHHHDERILNRTTL